MSSTSNSLIGKIKTYFLSNKLSRRVIDKIFYHNQKSFFDSIRSRNKNYDFTLITNNCIGGFIYKNLNLVYRTPTIWISMSCEDYVEFVKFLQYYLEQEITELESEAGYPVGMITPDNPEYKSIVINFVHYKSFSEAVEKWKNRIARINFDNIYYIMDFYQKYDDESILYEFNGLNLKSAVISDKFYEGIDNLYVADFDKSEHNTIFKNDGLSGKLLLDRWDYVSFLN